MAIDSGDIMALIEIGTTLWDVTLPHSFILGPDLFGRLFSGHDQEETEDGLGDTRVTIWLLLKRFY